MAKEQKSFFIEGTKMPLMITNYDWDGADMHWHNYWEMLVQCEGRTNIIVGRDKYISLPGNITIIRPNQLHETKSITDKHKILLLQFETSILMPFLDFTGGYKYMPLLINGGYKIKNRIEQADEEELGQALTDLLHVEKAKEEGYELEMYSKLLHILFILVHKEYLMIPPMEDEAKNALLSLKNAMVFIDQHYDEKINQQELAEMCFMSPAHFSRQFKKATGLNMVDYVNKVRLKEATRLLITSRQNISEISSLTGFSTVNYFNRVFKNTYQVTPKEYKNKIV